MPVHWAEGKPRDELAVNFEEIAGDPLPCVYIEGSPETYDYAMSVIKKAVLRLLYEKYGDRLLEANVRSFLSATGKVNKGIQATLRHDPESLSHTTTVSSSWRMRPDWERPAKAAPAFRG